MLAEAAVTFPHIGHCQRHVGNGKGTEQDPGQPLGPAARPGAGLRRLESQQARAGAALTPAGLRQHCTARAGSTRCALTVRR